MAYATLSAATIEVEGLPPETARRLPRYPLLPAALIGRLAVDQRVQGRGIGELLLMDMLRRCVTIRAQLGLLAVVVDAKDQRAADFYRRYGFQPLIGSQLRFFLPIKTVQTLFPNADTQP
jgi:GNAT superfamily N-acetyltransferase